MKPLGRKTYGSIPHLPASRMSPADHACTPGMARIATERPRDERDRIIVEEKLDGSCVGVAHHDGRIFALGRAGYLAQTSGWEQHQLFAAYVRERENFWRYALRPGQRLICEWMAQAHGTRYTLPHGPLVAFDLMEGDRRLPFNERQNLCARFEIPTPRLLHVGGPLSIEEAMTRHGDGDHGLIFDPPEGAVWRVERDGEFDFIVKWVRPDKVDGKYLSEFSGAPPIWNWRPSNESRLAA